MSKQHTIEKETVWQEFSTLPLEAQYQVIEFMTFLHNRYASHSSADMPQGRLSDDPFIGMWQDRKDMQASSAYVKNLRRREWDTT
jgi:hypothetical protein